MWKGYRVRGAHWEWDYFVVALAAMVDILSE
jgi:hypothetical protein